MERIVSLLKKDKDESEQIVTHLDAELNAAVQKIKSVETIPRREIEEEHLRLVTRVNVELRALEKKLDQQKNAEEQENLRRIQAQMEVDRKKREEEAKWRAEEEELRKKKVELEVRRKREEEQQRERRAAKEAVEKIQQLELHQEQQRANRGGASAAREGEDLSVEDAMARAIEEDSMARHQLEQERRDRELAMRLAREMGVQVEESGLAHTPGPQSPARSMTRSPQGEAGAKKYDLTKWKYSDLRDAINTSCDVELLEACREEFHRRLKVYHAWKAKNKRRDAAEGVERAPRSVVDSVRFGSSTPRYEKFSGDESQQRFFRIPFVRPVGDDARADLPAVTGGRKGWWYAHFDGQYVARQMEIHDQRVPVLLIAGKDDVHMCELSLEETGLTRKRGAEILEEEFEREWIRHGGPPYIRPAGRKIGK